MENLGTVVQPTIGYFGAFFGGILSFFSPCVLPLVPLFFGILMPDLKNTALTLKRGIAFFIGLSLFFSILGALAGLVGTFLSKFQYIFNIIAGILLFY
ncbi:cytochrome c biogenesis CcdA family protein [Marinitoga lauensis]|uniref:cytochrome c biogenesis CcdA family protein n=1 Tax=Marinitoga lauensis TaxID=2201189 RepID=UPI001F0FD93D|nr:cytochrome c biogenesis protein CcdA [Marinitoga lauensis]